LQGVFAQLFRESWNGVVVGGQAVNLWASRYSDQIPQIDSFRPLTSRDLDFHGGPREARHAMDILGASGKINDGTDPSPNAGVLELQIGENRTLLIDILTGVLGISSAELLRTSVRWSPFADDRGLEVSVIHPLLLLESKLACLRTLSQAGRQDEKHIRLMVCVIRAWLGEQLVDPRQVFRVIERIASMMMTPFGVHAHQQGIELWDSIPVKKMQSNASYNLFFERRYDQLQQEVDSRRVD
jgi:hypothetical protein